MPQIDLGQVVGPQGAQGEPGPQGAQGIQGPAGPAATINGVNALTIEAGDNIELSQSDSTTTLSVPTDAAPTEDSTKPVQSGGVAAALNNKPNRNLLDNWYFPMAVNQRGDTSWTNGGYHLDRWFMEADADGAIDSDGFHIGSGVDVVQKRPLEEANNLLGKTVTVSCLLSDGSFGFSTGDIPNEIPAESIGVTANIKGGVSFGVAFIGNAKSYQFGRISNYSGSEIVVVACKTEFGPQQTLAHQDEEGNWVLNEIPDYGAELAKCQRYFRRFPANWSPGGKQTTNAVFTYGINPPMRTTPVVSLQNQEDLTNAIDDGTTAITPTAVIFRTVNSQVIGFYFTVIPSSTQPCIFNQRYLDASADL